MRSSSAIATSRCEWPSPIGEETKSARLRRDRPRTHRVGRGGGADEVAQEQVDLDGIADVRAVTRALEQHELAACCLGEPDPAPGAGDRILRPLDHEHRTANAFASSRVASLLRRPSTLVAISVSGVVSRPQPTQSSIGFVECGSVNISAKKNSRKPR